jgi:hypothetical protein
MLLPRKQSFVHDLRDFGDEAVNELVRTDATLPNPTQKVDSYILVDLESLDIDFRDKERTVGGSARSILADGLLQCSVEASSREVITRVERIVEDVAQEAGLSTAEVVAQAKASVASAVEREERFSPEEVGREVFDSEPQLRERFEEAVREERLPEEVPMRRGVANRMAKNHKIKTDTGIEISFPSEYATDSNYIEFTADNAGNVSIIIKNVARIENK